MFLQLNHQKLDIYSASRELCLACYRLTTHFPSHERFGMISQIRRAALSVHFNTAEGASRRSEAERKRFYEIARGSLIEIDAAMDIASDLNYLDNHNADNIGEKIIRCFKLLTGLIKSHTQ